MSCSRWQTGGITCRLFKFHQGEIVGRDQQTLIRRSDPEFGCARRVLRDTFTRVIKCSQIELRDGITVVSQVLPDLSCPLEITAAIGIQPVSNCFRHGRWRHCDDQQYPARNEANRTPPGRTDLHPNPPSIDGGNCHILEAGRNS